MAYPRFTPERPRDELERLHHVEGVSVQGLADLEGCSSGTMKRYLERAGVEISPQRGRPPRFALSALDAERIKALIATEDGVTVSKLATEFKVTPELMRRALAEAGIAAPSARNLRSTASDGLMIRDYLAGDSMYRLMQRYGTHQPTVERLLKSEGVDIRGRTEAGEVRTQQIDAADAHRLALREGALARVAEKTGLDEATLRAALDAEGLLLHDLDQ
jgi:hypothetical protein